MNLYSGRTEPAYNSQRITLKEFGSGYSLFSINLSPQNHNQFFPGARDGAVRIELRFAEELPESVVMITKSTSPGLFQLDYARNIYLS